MKYLLLIVVFLAIFCSKTNAQELKLSYNSSIIYPGVKVGYEIPFVSKDIEKVKRSGKIKRFKLEWLLSVNAAFYHHEYYHDNLYVTAGISFRKIKPSGFFCEFSPELGVSRTFLDGTTYSFDDEGNMEIGKPNGYFYPLLSIGGGFGYDFSVKKSLPIAVFTKLNLISMYPYNSGLYFRPTFELGVSYRLK
jgi:hypothetical protein